MMVKEFLKAYALAAVMTLALGACDQYSANAHEASAPTKSQTDGKAKASLQSSRTGYADVKDGRIFYQVYGDLSSETTPLLVLHGSFMSGDAMMPFINAFASSRPVIAIDARGHGRTGDLPGQITYEMMADDAASVLTSLNVPKADLLGYSMGGTTAIIMAIRHPGQVGKQIIVSGVSRQAGWNPEVLQGLAKATPKQFAGTTIETEYRRLSPTPDKFATFVDEVLGVEKSFKDASADEVRAIDGKTMIFIGDADGVTLDHAVELYKLRGGGDRQAAAQGFISDAPRARLAILPATSHIGMMANAELIGQLATPFLEDQRPPRATGFFEGMDAPPTPTPDTAKH